MSDSALIIARLKQIRRRLFLALLINASSVALFGLAMIFVLLNQWPVFSFPLPKSLMVLLFPLVLISAAGAALLRMPTWEKTARIVDRRAGLQQRLETAWEYIEPSCEIEALLVRDAREKLSHVRPETVAPVRLVRMTRVVLNIGMISICAFSLVHFLSGWNRPALMSPGITADHAASAEQQGRQATVSPRGTAAETKRRTQEPDQNRAGAPSSPGMTNSFEIALGAKRELQFGSPITVSEPGETAAVDKVPLGDDAAQSPAARIRGLTASYKATSAGRDEKLASGTSGASRPIASPQKISDSGSNPFSASAGAASIRAMAARGNAPQGGTAGGPRTQADGGRGFMTENSRGLPGDQDLSKGDAEFLARHAGNYQSYWLAAEEALAKEKIPPGFKKYIADYFAAIHR